MNEKVEAILNEIADETCEAFEATGYAAAAVFEDESEDGPARACLGILDESGSVTRKINVSFNFVSELNRYTISANLSSSILSNQTTAESAFNVLVRALTARFNELEDAANCVA